MKSQTRCKPFKKSFLLARTVILVAGLLAGWKCVCQSNPFSFTPSYSQYTNFSMAINAEPGNPTFGDVSISGTLPAVTYSVLTNSSLRLTNWGVLTNVVATGTNTFAASIPLSSSNLYLKGKIVLPNTFVLTNGLVAYWKMNDESGTTAADSSGNGVTLPLIGSPSWGPGFLILNGYSQYGDAGSNALASLDNHDKTICAWVYKTNANFAGIVDKSLAATNGGWGFWDTGTNLAWHVSDGTGYYVDTGVQTTRLNEWFYTSVVWYATNRVEFYLDGIQNSYATNAGYEIASGTADLEVGNLHNNYENGAFCLGGYVRDVAVYDRALQPSEIMANFLNCESSTNILYPDLLYYKMEDYNSSNATSPTFPILDSSTHGGTTGTYDNVSDTWVTNVAGIPDTALHFSGDIGYIQTSNSTLFNFTSNFFSINFWVNPYGVTSGYVLMQNGISYTNGWYLALNGNDTITFGTETNGQDFSFRSAGTTLNGHYTMVTVVRNNPTNASIYLNGNLSATGIITSPAPSTNCVQIGCNLSGGYVLDGNIWLMQIWSTPLSDTDVANLFMRQTNGSPWP